MKNILITLIFISLTSFTTNAISENTKPPTRKEVNDLHVKWSEKAVVAQNFTINVGRGATYFGIYKKLSEVSGVHWTWELVDRVIASHQLVYGKEILKPNHKFIISL